MNVKTWFDIYKVSEEHRARYAPFILKRQFKKGEMIQKSGDINPYSHYVITGCLRSYITDEKNKEHIFSFASEGWIISDVDSQTHNSPARLNIDVLEDCVIESIPHYVLIEILALGYTDVNRLFNRIATLQKRILLLLSANAQTRYQDFIDTYPDIVQRVSQKMIASYLGVTPEALSKIRNLMAKKH